MLFQTTVPKLSVAMYCEKHVLHLFILECKRVGQNKDEKPPKIFEGLRII